MGLTIIGLGEVGRVFARSARAGGEEVCEIRRGDDPKTRALSEGPILVSVREDDLPPLAPLIERDARRTAFVQNGWLEGVLSGGFSESTRGLIWFTAKGEFFRVLRRSIFFGAQAIELVRILRAGGVEAEVEYEAIAFMRELAAKLAWNNVVGLPLAVHGVTLAEYLEKHRQEAKAIVEETIEVLSEHLAIAIDPGRAFDTLIETTKELGWATGGKRAISYRNGAIVRLGRIHGIRTPVNTRLIGS